MTRQFPQRPFVPSDDATEIVMIRHGAAAAALPGDAFPPRSARARWPRRCSTAA